jgi:hypothetical protein
MNEVYFYARQGFGSAEAVRAEELGCILMRPMEYVSGPFVFVAATPNGYKVAVEKGTRHETAFSSTSLDECIGFAKRLSSVTKQPA